MEKQNLFLNRDQLLVASVLWVLVLQLPFFCASARPSASAGFISIDCGSEPGDTGRTVPFVSEETGIIYEYDKYITTGFAARVTTDGYRTEDDLRTLRHFPSGSTPRKNCYVLPVHNNTQYLIRARFYFGYYVNPPASSVLTFQLALDSAVWATLIINTTQNLLHEQEAIIFTNETRLSVCLIRTEESSAPFINTLELRPLGPGSYLARYTDPGPFSVFLSLLQRCNFGEPTKTIRFPDDVYDRKWPPLVVRDGVFVPGYPSDFLLFNDNSSLEWDNPPSIVMQSAATAENDLTFWSSPPDVAAPRLFTNVFFAEIVPFPERTRRIMDFRANFVAKSRTLDLAAYGPDFTVVEVGEIFQAPARMDNLTFSLTKSNNSLDGPIVNAFEAYLVLDVISGTNAGDVTALTALKSAVGFEYWAGDPCFPVPWDELNCNMSDRVTSLDLSGKGLNGSIPSEIYGLGALTLLNLSNNAFTGALPSWVANLDSLQTLDVSNNQLSGNFPATYFTHIPGFRYSGNLQLNCVPSDNATCPPAPAAPPAPSSVTQTPLPLPSNSAPGPSVRKRGSNIWVIAGSIAGGICVIFAVGGLVFWFSFYKLSSLRKSQAPDPSEISEVHIDSRMTYTSKVRGRARAFSLQPVEEATNSFAEKVGEGASGSVFYGILKDTSQEVAVKILSGKPDESMTQFSEEIDLLATVCNEKLISLIGYCIQGENLMLLFEYVSGGDVRDHLYGDKAKRAPLRWSQRLKIALDVAKGLELLHGWNPAILHGNVNSSKVLLTESLEAKLAGFQLTNLGYNGGTHCMVKETTGYVDPEYRTSGMLTEMSDVYSFGVVLLEILCGRPPISKHDPTYVLAEQVPAAINTGNLQAMVDPKLLEKYKEGSVWRFAEVAMSCVQVAPSLRPSMSQVVVGLEEALALESGAEDEAPPHHSMTSATHRSPDMTQTSLPSLP